MNPLALLKAIPLKAWIAIGVVVAFAGVLIWGMGQRTARFAAEKDLSDYRFEAAVAAQRAQEEADAKYIEQLLINQETLRAYNTGLATLRGELYQLRLTRPDGSEVPTLSAPAARAEGTTRECVPLEDYRALEGRAARDAWKLMQIQARDARLAGE